MATHEAEFTRLMGQRDGELARVGRNLEVLRRLDAEGYIEADDLERALGIAEGLVERYRAAVGFDEEMEELVRDEEEG